MSSETKKYVYEITSIEKELARIRKQSKDLEKRRKELLTKTIQIMKERGDNEVEINGQKYTLEEKVVHGRKADKKKRQDALVVLEENGIQRYEAEEIYNKLATVLRGQEKVLMRLKR